MSENTYDLFARLMAPPIRIQWGISCLEPITPDEIWAASRDSGTAVVLTLSEEDAHRVYRDEPDTREWRERRALELNRHHVEGQAAENRRRDFATLEVCEAVLYAYCNSRELERRRIAEALGLRDFVAALYLEQPMATETEMFRYLVYEMDAHPSVADRASAAVARSVNAGHFTRRVLEVWHHG